MEEKKYVYFWQKPVYVLSMSLLLIIILTGVFIFLFDETSAENDNSQYSLFSSQIIDLSNIVPASSVAETVIQQKLAYIEANFDTMPVQQLQTAINDILVIAPDNRDALLLAAQLAMINHDLTAAAAATGRLYNFYHEQAYLYLHTEALHKNGQSSRAYDLIRKDRDPDTYSPLLELLTAELAAANNDTDAALRYWQQAGSPQAEHWEYPFLAEILQKQGLEDSVK